MTVKMCGDHPPRYDDVTGSTSSPTMLKKALSANYALVSFSWTDRIRLLRFPDLWSKASAMDGLKASKT